MHARLKMEFEYLVAVHGTWNVLALVSWTVHICLTRLCIYLNNLNLIKIVNLGTSILTQNSLAATLSSF